MLRRLIKLSEQLRIIIHGMKLSVREKTVKDTSMSGIN